MARFSFHIRNGKAARKRKPPKTMPEIAPPIRLNHDCLVVSVDESSAMPLFNRPVSFLSNEIELSHKKLLTEF